MNEELNVGNELTSLRKEVYEARNLIIRNDNLLRNLQIDLKDVGRRMEVSERRHFVGHVGAYVAIAAISISGALLYGAAAARSSQHEADALLEEAKQKKAAAEAAEESANKRMAEYEQANAEVMVVWQLVTSTESAKQEEGLARATKVDRNKLSSFARAVLDSTAGAMLRNRGEQVFDSGLALYKRGSIREAKPELERFLALAQKMPPEWKKTERTLATFHLGAICNQLGEHDQAIPYLRGYVAQSESAANKAYAYLLLGDSLEATKQTQEAQNAYRAGIELAPSGYTGVALKKRLAVLETTSRT